MIVLAYSPIQLLFYSQLCRSIEETCSNLICIIEAYQDRLCGLAHEENALGKFFKECGKIDKDWAGKIMTASGKTLCYTAQQRIQLRLPLVRLYQELETFQYRAITDIFATIDQMEKSRNAYRGALLWMKDLSQELNPDTYMQLEKFRKVQAHVRKTKVRFDKLKNDTVQKIDMLSASRCNMFSNSLVLYQNALINFWEKTSKTMNVICENLETNLSNEASKKLCEANNFDDLSKLFQDDLEDKDTLIFFDAEYHDDDNDDKKSKYKKIDKVKARQMINNEQVKPTQGDQGSSHSSQDLLSWGFDNDPLSLFQDSKIDLNQIWCSDSFLPSQLLSQSLDKLVLEPKIENKADRGKQSSATREGEEKKDKKQEWYNIFGELDPLSNPDLLAKKGDDDRYC